MEAGMNIRNRIAAASRALGGPRTTTLLTLLAVLLLGVLASASAALAAAPVVTSVLPKSGPAGGGTSVTISGSGFTGASTVDFGTTPASFTVKSSSTIKAIAPAGSGTVDVTVTTPEGTSEGAPANAFTYIPLEPAVDSVFPNKGPVHGGQTITIKGTGFSEASAVDFGATPATSFEVRSTTLIKAVDPVGSGTVDVTVTGPLGVSMIGPSDQFTYVGSPPEVSQIAPTKGPAAGGNIVNVIGFFFTFASEVHFGSVPAESFTVESDNAIAAVAPPGTVGRVDVTVTTPYGTSSFEYCPRNRPCSVRDSYKYAEPTITGIGPSSGPVAGGTSVTVTGAGFGVGETATKFKFGGIAAVSADCASNTTCTVVSPPHAKPAVQDIRATIGGFTTPITAADKFTYE
jgi:hypothetical protein